MANTFELIASYEVGAGGQSAIDFTSIPSTYTDLVVKCSLRSAYSGIDSALVTFNNSGSGYSYRSIWADGSTVASYNGSSQSFLQIQYMPGTAQTANTFLNAEFYIPNYANSVYKSASLDSVEENNATTAYAIPQACIVTGKQIGRAHV